MDPRPSTDRAGALAERRFPATLQQLTADWLAAMPDVIARLESARHPRIADVGCGHGWSTLALAHAFLDARVDGLDTNPGSIADARRHAADAGLDGRVRFLQADAAELAGPYDLVLVHETLHDLARPVQTLRAARAALAPGGALLVVDERVAERFTAPGDEVVRELATAAGFARVDVVPVDDDVFRLYRLHP